MIAARGTPVTRSAQAGLNGRSSSKLAATLRVLQGGAQPDLAALAVFLLEVPLALLAPAEAGRAERRDEIAAGLVDRDAFPVGIVGLAERALEVGGAQLPVGDQPSVLLDQLHQQREVRIFAGIIGEIFRLPVDVEFAQHDMAERERERRVGALLGVQPDVGEFRRLVVIGRDHRALGAAIADLRIEMGVGRPRHRDVRSPDEQEAGIVPVGALRHVGLLAPGLRA
jgi:hypothetical protein